MDVGSIVLAGNLAITPDQNGIVFTVCPGYCALLAENAWARVPQVRCRALVSAALKNVDGWAGRRCEESCLCYKRCCVTRHRVDVVGGVHHAVVVVSAQTERNYAQFVGRIISHTKLPAPGRHVPSISTTERNQIGRESMQDALTPAPFSNSSFAILHPIFSEWISWC
jgi:hypothetical protein